MDVLIVEDETPLRLLLEATLRQKGYQAEGVAARHQPAPMRMSRG